MRHLTMKRTNSLAWFFEEQFPLISPNCVTNSNSLILSQTDDACVQKIDTHVHAVIFTISPLVCTDFVFLCVKHICFGQSIE